MKKILAFLALVSPLASHALVLQADPTHVSCQLVAPQPYSSDVYVDVLIDGNAVARAFIGRSVNADQLTNAAIYYCTSNAAQAQTQGKQLRIDTLASDLDEVLMIAGPTCQTKE